MPDYRQIINQALGDYITPITADELTEAILNAHDGVLTVSYRISRIEFDSQLDSIDARAMHALRRLAIDAIEQRVLPTTTPIESRRYLRAFYGSEGDEVSETGPWDELQIQWIMPVRRTPETADNWPNDAPDR